MKKILLLIIPLLYLYSCNSDNPVSPGGGTTPDNYSKINTFESGNVKFELWSATGQSLFNGYNEIGFKVFINGDEKKNGYVKFHPMMFHGGIGGGVHSSPVSEKYYYNNTMYLFTGYVCYIMISDTSQGSYWFGNFNYNDESFLDTLPYNVQSLSSNQMLLWDNIYTGYSYFLTLINPKNPVLGSNIFSCILHKTNDDIYYKEVDSAQMYIRPWMESHGHGSSNNVDPVWKGGGIYEGSAVFTMPGYWDVYDSIKVNGTFITPTPTKKFSFAVH